MTNPVNFCCKFPCLFGLMIHRLWSFQGHLWFWEVGWFQKKTANESCWSWKKCHETRGPSFLWCAKLCQGIFLEVDYSNLIKTSLSGSRWLVMQKSGQKIQTSHDDICPVSAREATNFPSIGSRSFWGFKRPFPFCLLSSNHMVFGHVIWVFDASNVFFSTEDLKAGCLCCFVQLPFGAIVRKITFA